jgi:CelD/BcsL family acetyltransferase involved in cellulose biosynthesis
MTFSVGELTSVEELVSAEGEWVDLFDRCENASPFQRPEWIIAWCKHARPAGIWTLTVRFRGRLVALAPWLVYEREGRRIVAFLAGGVSDYHDVIVDPALRNDAVREIFLHLDQRREVWEGCDFEQLGRHSTLRNANAPSHWIDERRHEEPCPMLELPPLPTPLSAVVPSRQLARLRKCRRRTANGGRLALELVEDASRREALHELLGHHGARWAAKNGDAVVSEPLRAFHEEVVTVLCAPNCQAQVYRLKLGGDTMAALYGLVSGGTLHCYMQAFDPDLAGASPGLLLVGAVLEHAQACGIRVVDFLRGAEPYKLAWGARGSPNVRRTFRRAGEP